jgi:hypothetical protein
MPGWPDRHNHVSHPEPSMPTRIIFNGQEYAGAEAMPEDVRKA